MGNAGSGHSPRQRRPRGATHPPLLRPPSMQQYEFTGNQYVFAATAPYPPQYQNFDQPQYYQYPGYYPQSMTPPFQGYHGQHYTPNWANGSYPYEATYSPAIMPYVEHQKAVTIRNDVNVKKESLRVELDRENSGKFLVSFTFDATAPGIMTVIFFAKEGVDCNVTPTKENLLKPVTVSFQEGLGQEFRQPSGTGIDLSMFEDELKADDRHVFPLVVKAEASPLAQSESNENLGRNSQITQAVFDKEEGEYQVRVIKQILWVNGTRYELQEIYGIGNAAEENLGDSDTGKDCVICLSEPRDTTVLPCRHMCMCSECAKVLRFQTNRCPICRQPVERLLEIKVNGDPVTEEAL